MYITKENFPIDLEKQSIEIPGSNGVRQSTLAPTGVALDLSYGDAKTFVDVIQRGYDISKNGPCLGWRDSNSDYKWIHYGEVIERSKNISYGLLNIGMKKGQDSRIGIFSRNCVESVLLELACSFQSAVFVQFYDSLGPATCSFILNHVEAEFLVCDTAEKAKLIIDVKDNIPMLHHIVVIEEVNEEFKTLAEMKGVTIHQLKCVEESGKEKPQSLFVPSPDDLLTICFTSGTTGNPKGVMLTHRNIIVNACSICRHYGLDFISAEDVYLSYLPIAHVFDRMGQMLLYVNGGSIGFSRGDAKLLLEDLSVLKPTIMIAVPRILIRIFDMVQNSLQSNKAKKLLMKISLQMKQAELERGIIRNNSEWDNFVLNDVKSIFGGRLRLLLVGAAPMKREVLLFFKCSLGCVVVEGYGQTECAGGSNCCVMGDCNVGIVGPPTSCCFMKLIDVPEMNYYARNGEGEVLVKGPTIMKGYFKEPEKTEEILDQEGWLHTGDIGRWNKNGALAIIDRKKHIMKLSQGMFVFPEKIGSVYLDSAYVENIFVHGDSLKNFLVAVVSPDKKMLMSWCFEEGITGTWEEICNNEVVKAHVLNDMNDLGKKAGLKGYEQVKVVHLHPDGFSHENAILTATMKIKRKECQRRFKDVIEKMYVDKDGESENSNAFE